jgi:hypothetical protein
MNIGDPVNEQNLPGREQGKMPWVEPSNKQRIYLGQSPAPDELGLLERYTYTLASLTHLVTLITESQYAKAEDYAKYCKAGLLAEAPKLKTR